MHTSSKRPSSVWVAQIILGLFGLFALVGVVLGVAYFGRYVDGPMRTAFLFVAAFQIVWIAVLAAASWAMLKRKNWGRWLTVGVFCYFLVSMLANTYLGQPAGQSSAYASGYMIGSLLILLPFGYLIFRLAFGDAAVDFFTARDSEPESPPPPPSFEL